MSSKLDLAIFGKLPAFAEKVHVGRPNVGNREHLLARINDMLDRVWFTNNGPYVQEFETKLAAFFGVRHCVAMCNGTVVLEIAIFVDNTTDENWRPAHPKPRISPWPTWRTWVAGSRAAAYALCSTWASITQKIRNDFALNLVQMENKVGESRAMWATSDSDLQAMSVAYLENRAFGK